ncbi:MAG: prepilin-type N-terminal cleavage/methylation domain-containing protein [Pseudomonadota bacterium]|nr:prepilin-type N-terminal cleavage/methylation domain-containing protein [Pseudomonadota bacterium]
MNKQYGFTLTEIAIVILIIGLLIGSVLKGQQMITTAKIKNIEGNYSSLAKAIYTYQERYSALPGDDNAASRFRFIQKGAANNGNGDGIIGNDDQSYKRQEKTLDKEVVSVWLHLRAASLIPGPKDPTQADDADPFKPIENAFGGLIGVESNRLNIEGVFVGFTDIPFEIAEILDARHDDKQPAQGLVQAESNDILANNPPLDNYDNSNPLVNILFAL